ncbi:hypothetical protein MK079_01165 [Candidatus Gracilibacteria bacterium]|nr:hypothetical protein [Candidatus Gracilibacteria bacterium]
MAVVSVDIPNKIAQNIDTSKVVAFEDIYVYQDVDVEYDVHMSGKEFLKEMRENDGVSHS